MSGPSSNDNAALPMPTPHPDAHGQAAMLLVESLIHGLVAQSHLTVAKAIEIIDVAVDVSRTMEEEAAHQLALGPRASTLLLAMSKSLGHDLPRS